MKLFISFYLLTALLYTTTRILQPVLTTITGTGKSESSSKSRSTLVQLRTKSAVGGSKPQKKAAAAVKASDIKTEESEERVWGGSARKKTGVLGDGQELVELRMNGLEGVEWGLDRMDWEPYQPLSSIQQQSNTATSSSGISSSVTNLNISIPEDDFLSIAFSSALHPSKVIPYYYRASVPDDPGFSKEDITITTLITSNRFTVFSKLVERYQG